MAVDFRAFVVELLTNDLRSEEIQLEAEFLKKNPNSCSSCIINSSLFWEFLGPVQLNLFTCNIFTFVAFESQRYKVMKKKTKNLFEFFST